MECFTELTAVAAPLRRDNIDTDIIIRIERIFDAPRDALGPWAFEMLRYGESGMPDPDFILNRPGYGDAQILLTGSNFGCGSSREAAVWAMQGIGLRVVIASSFGAIFYNNCFQTGMLPIVLDAAQIDRLMAEVEVGPQQAPLTIDLVAREVRSAAGLAFPFVIEDRRRAALLEGADEITFTLRHDADISAFRQRDEGERPWIYI